MEDMDAMPEDDQEEENESYDHECAEKDMETILEAKRIQKDPKRMAAVKRCAQEEVSEMKALQALASGK